MLFSFSRVISSTAFVITSGFNGKNIIHLKNLGSSIYICDVCVYYQKIKNI